MSPAAARRLQRHQRHTCRACQKQRARFRYRGEVRADRDHTLCFRCFRAEVNRQRARRLAGSVNRRLGDLRAGGGSHEIAAFIYAQFGPQFEDGPELKSMR